MDAVNVDVSRSAIDSRSLWCSERNDSALELGTTVRRSEATTIHTAFAPKKIGYAGRIVSVFVPRRLDKFLRDSTPLSVAEVRDALVAGRVTLDGSTNVEADRLVFERDDVRLDGAPLAPQSEHFHAMFHKPGSVTSTSRDPERKADLARWLEEMPAGVFPIGRLDRATTGLLLFTSDGDLANAILQPGHHTEKVYWLWLDEAVSDDDPRWSQMCEGVDVGDERLSVASASIQNRTPDFTELLVRLCEGKNRQIRRLCRALDFRLVGLHRRSVGPIEIGELPMGAWRPLTTQEVESLWNATGGRERVRLRKIAALTRQAMAAKSAGRPEARLDEWLTWQASLR